MPKNRTVARGIYQSLIEAVYRKFNAEKLEDVPRLMDKYVGQEAEIYDKIVRKYVFEREGSTQKDWRPLIEAMYRRFNPSKLKEMGSLLEKYKDNEADLYQALCDKYIPTVDKDDPPVEFDVWASPSCSSSSSASDIEGPSKEKDAEAGTSQTPVPSAQASELGAGASGAAEKASVSATVAMRSATLRTSEGVDRGRDVSPAGKAVDANAAARRSPERSMSPVAEQNHRHIPATALARSKAFAKRRPRPPVDEAEARAIAPDCERQTSPHRLDKKSPSPLKRRRTEGDAYALAAAELRPKARPKSKPPATRACSPDHARQASQEGHAAETREEAQQAEPPLQEKKRRKRRKVREIVDGQPVEGGVEQAHGAVAKAEEELPAAAPPPLQEPLRLEGAKKALLLKKLEEARRARDALQGGVSNGLGGSPEAKSNGAAPREKTQLSKKEAELRQRLLQSFGGRSGGAS